MARVLAAGLSIVAPAMAAPRPLAAQSVLYPGDDAGEQLGIAAVNALAGGLTAGVTAWIRGQPVADAFLRGAGGGAVVYLGKRIATARFDGAGLLGREVGAVGGSVVANAGAGRGWLEEVWLPLGPVWVQASPASPRTVRVLLRDVATSIWAASRPELRMDWGRSLSTGVPVFVADEHRIEILGEGVDGFAAGAVVFLGPGGTNHPVLAHETIHVLQHDFAFLGTVRPIERWAMTRLVGVDVPVDPGVLPFLGYLRPIRELHEREAYALGSRAGLH